jgi:hypothetical protein
MIAAAKELLRADGLNLHDRSESMSAQPKSFKPSLDREAMQATQDPQVRRQRIAEIAYYLAEQRGFESGHEDDDWLEAEREIDGIVNEAKAAP